MFKIKVQTIKYKKKLKKESFFLQIKMLKNANIFFTLIDALVQEEKNSIIYFIYEAIQL